MRKLLTPLWLVLALGVAHAQDISPSLSLTSGSTPVTGCTTLNLFYNNAGTFGCMGGTSWDNTNRSLTITGATLTGSSAPIISATQTWNNVATTFTLLDFDVTDTTSAAASLLMNIKVGGALRMTLSKGGTLTVGNRYDTIGSFVGTSTASTFQSRNGATILSSPATATWLLGAADAASPVAQTLGVQSVVAGTSNTAGALWTQKGSAGTGTGVGGNIKWQVALAGGAGSTQNSFTDALTLEASAAVPRITAGGPIRRKGYTIAAGPDQLPTGVAGDEAYVTDQLTACPALGGTFTSGGNVVCSAFFDGTAWTHQ